MKIRRGEKGKGAEEKESPSHQRNAASGRGGGGESSPPPPPPPPGREGRPGSPWPHLAALANPILRPPLLTGARVYKYIDSPVAIVAPDRIQLAYPPPTPQSRAPPASHAAAAGSDLPAPRESCHGGRRAEGAAQRPPLLHVRLGEPPGL